MRRRRKPYQPFAVGGLLVLLYGIGISSETRPSLWLPVLLFGLLLVDGAYGFRVAGWLGRTIVRVAGWLLVGGFRLIARLVSGRRRLTGATDLQTILLMSSERFERFCGDLLEREGYRVKVTAPTGDWGVDVEFTAPSGAFGLAQAKRWTHTAVGRPVIQQLYGEMTHEGAAMGYVITTSRFTREAVEWAEGKRIGLIDGEQLELLATKYFGKITLRSADILAAPISEAIR